MKIANRVPAATKMPVRISDTEYHLYYSKPVNLGKIVKENGCWYTEDGMRFVSSRDALEYRIRVVEALASGREPDSISSQELAEAVQKHRRPKRKKKARKEKERAGASSAGETILAVPSSPSISGTILKSSDYALYQKFLEFVGQARLPEPQKQQPLKEGNP